MKKKKVLIHKKQLDANRNKRKKNPLTLFVMAIYYPTTCEADIPDPLCSDCLNPELGRIRSAGFIRIDFTFGDVTSAAEWTAGILAGKIYVIPATQGTFDGGTVNMKPGYGNVHERNISSTYKLMFKDPNYIGNCPFYNEMQKQTNWLPFFATETQVNIADKPAAIAAKAPVADDDTSEVVWEIEASWVSNNYPCPSDIPTGIFQCFAQT